MKHTLILAILAVLAFLAPARAHAELSATITWDEPGTVVIRIGSNKAAPVDLAPGATQHTASIDNSYGYAYVFPAEGCLMVRGEAVKANGSQATIMPSSFGGARYLAIDLAQYDGATIHAVVERVAYDAELEINIVNGRDRVECSFPGTGRELSLVTGVNKVAFSTVHEPNLCVTAPANGAEDYYVKLNGASIDWTSQGGMLKLNGSDDGVAVANGDKLEVKYCNTPDPSGSATVTLAYADDMARQALTMIFNITAYSVVSERGQFAVTPGDKVRLVFNTKDYDVWVNDAPVEPSAEATTAYVVTVDADMTLSLRAAERAYGTCKVTLHVANPQGVVVRAGDIDGPVVSLGEPVGTVEHKFQSISPSKTATLTTYQVEVGEKSPKVFVSSASGHWLQATEQADGNPSGVATATEPLYVLNPAVSKDTRLMVYLGVNTANCNAGDVKLRDRNQSYPLEAGYNEIMVDPEYSGAFSVSVYSAGQQPELSAYINMAALKTDDLDQLSATVDGESVMHIWAGRPAPAKVKLAARIDADAAGASVVADRVRSVADGQEISVFRTCEICVTPAGAPYLLNGEAPAFDGPTHTFAAAVDYVVAIGQQATGIEAVDADAVESDVYDIYGRLARRAGDSAPLARGIYISAGRKFLVR